MQVSNSWYQPKFESGYARQVSFTRQLHGACAYKKTSLIYSGSGKQMLEGFQGMRLNPISHFVSTLWAAIRVSFSADGMAIIAGFL